MAKSAKVTNEAVKALLAMKKNPKVIYDLHMAQARDAKKMFKGDTAMEAKIDTVIAKIKADYEQAMATV